MYGDDNKLGRLHWPLIVCVALIAALGVWNLASASATEEAAVWLQQLRALALGAVLVAGTLFLDYRMLRSLAWPIYVGTLVMLVLVPFVGREIMGAKRWLSFGPVNLQPSEFAKISVILMLARFFGDHPSEERIVRTSGFVASVVDRVRQIHATALARYRKALAAPPRPMRPTRSLRVTGYRLQDLWWPFLVLFVPVIIVIRQPDLGTGLVTTAIGGSMILFAGLTFGTFAFLASSGVAVAVLTWFFGLKPYQKDRIITFLDPNHDAMGKGYHTIQSQIAVGSGQTWGKGWGNGTQNQLLFLPEQHTDFAFPVWAEEHGFVGAALMVLLFLFLVYCALDIASHARDRFGAFLAFGAAALFFWHAFINIGMVLGVLPVVGVPLLLVSYGGSSAVLTMLAVGVLLNVSLRRTPYSS